MIKSEDFFLKKIPKLIEEVINIVCERPTTDVRLTLECFRVSCHSPIAPAVSSTLISRLSRDMDKIETQCLSFDIMKAMLSSTDLICNHGSFKEEDVAKLALSWIRANKPSSTDIRNILSCINISNISAESEILTDLATVIKSISTEMEKDDFADFMIELMTKKIPRKWRTSTFNATFNMCMSSVLDAIEKSKANKEKDKDKKEEKDEQSFFRGMSPEFRNDDGSHVMYISFELHPMGLGCFLHVKRQLPQHVEMKFDVSISECDFVWTGSTNHFFDSKSIGYGFKTFISTSRINTLKKTQTLTFSVTGSCRPAIVEI